MSKLKLNRKRANETWRKIFMESSRLSTGKLRLPRWLNDEESAYQCKSHRPIPGSGRSPGKGSGNPLQYSCLENPMDTGACQATVPGSQRVRYSHQTTRSRLGDEQILSGPGSLPAIYRTQKSKLKLHRRRGNETCRKVLQGEFKTIYRNTCLKKVWKSAGNQSILQGGGVYRKPTSHAVSRTIRACEGLLSGDAALNTVPSGEGGLCALEASWPCVSWDCGRKLQTGHHHACCTAARNAHRAVSPDLAPNPLAFPIPAVSPGVMFC